MQSSKPNIPTLLTQSYPHTHIGAHYQNVRITRRSEQGKSEGQLMLGEQPSCPLSPSLFAN
jgi:hypothetical protein